MVICSACPTPQPAGAAWYRWVTPSVPSECSTQSRAATVTDRDDVAASVPLRARTVSLSMLRKCVPHRPVALQGNKPAKSLAPQRRRGLVQRPMASAPMRRCCVSAAPVALVCQPDRPHPRSFSRCVVVLLRRATRQPVLRRLTKTNDKYRRAK